MRRLPAQPNPSMRSKERTHLPRLAISVSASAKDVVLVGMAGRDEAVLVGDGDESGAVMAVELAQDVADVALRGQRADDELPRDLGIAQPTGDKDEDVALAVGEFSESRRRLPRVGSRGELGDEPASDARGEQRLTGRDDLDAA